MLSELSERYADGARGEVTLMVEVPRYLFPFVRNIIANTTRDGGFPPLLLSPINFGKLHDSRRQAQKSSVSASATI